jgi:hypothetical protein
MLELAQTQLQKWARCSTAVFPKMFTFREKLSQAPPVPEEYNVTPPTPKITSPPLVAAVYNKLTGSGGGWCVSIECPAYLAPALCIFCLLSVVFSSISCHP